MSESSLKDKGQNGNLENCVPECQIITSSSVEGSKRYSEEDVKTCPKTVEMKGAGFHIESSNGVKENNKLYG